MYDKFDNTYQVRVVSLYVTRRLLPLLIFPCLIYVVLCLLQATIGIDFLSKTMYLEDRTVRLQLWYVLIAWNLLSVSLLSGGVNLLLIWCGPSWQGYRWTREVQKLDTQLHSRFFRRSCGI